jgi:hypothetical protein
VKVEYVIVADYAIATEDGRFNAIGAGIRYVASPRFPHTFPNLAILVSLAFDERDVGKQFKLELTLVGPDGSVLLGGPNDWFVGPEGAPNFVCATLSGQHIQFAHPGDYMVVVGVDGNVQLTQTITASQVSATRGRG